MDKKMIDTITYDVTMNCNLRCKHCYNAEYLSEGRDVELDIEKVMQAFSKIDFNNLLIQGGEPLIVTNLEKLIERCNQKNINVYITTNATLLSPERSISLIKAGIKGIFFSVESACPKVNDNIRGKGTFDLFYKNVKNFMNIYWVLREKKYISNIKNSLSCTVSDLNFDTRESFRKIFILARELRIDDIIFNFLIKYGGCKNIDYNQGRSNFEFANEIVRISKEFPQISVRLPMKQIEHEYLKKVYGENINIYGAKENCPAGNDVAYVDEKLNMYPCIWLAHKGKGNYFAVQNTISLYEDIPYTVFSTFFEKKQKCNIVFHECYVCKYKGKCIPVCPCQEEAEIMEYRGEMCPTRKEIREYYYGENFNINGNGCL